MKSSSSPAAGPGKTGCQLPQLSPLILLILSALLMSFLVTGADAQQQSALDFQAYRSRIEPIFLKKRQGDIRCYDCHSALSTRFRLEKLEPGHDSWTEKQSRKNLEFVSKLVTPAQPLQSRLLLHPLAPEAGGDSTHGGGKFWTSQTDPEWQVLAEWVKAASPSVATLSSAPDKTPPLSFEVFKAEIEPIFLKQRSGHARCYNCHILAGRTFHLAPLTAGTNCWTDEQSRQNFQRVLQVVVPGDPGSSRLLVHPLAPEAGGDAFHSGGRQFESKNDPDWQTIASWIKGDPPDPPQAAGSTASWIYVTNSAADTVDVLDAANNRVIQVIRGIELPHGVTFSPDGKRVYISNESENVLDVVDRKSGTILQKVALSGRPNNITITKEGRRVLVGIRAQPGSVDVIDTTLLRRVKSIAVDGSVHNIYVTPDGKYVVSGSIENKTASVIDLNREEVAWKLKFDQGVRPMAFERKADGSTSRIFVQLSEFNGFAVVDFDKRAEVTRIKLPDKPSGFGAAEGRLGTPSHGIGVSPDERSLWVNSTLANATFKYSLPDLKLMGYVRLPEVHGSSGRASGAVPEWVTFTPDSKFVYISNSAARSVSVIDTQAIKQVAEVPVGEVPKRINTLSLP